MNLTDAQQRAVLATEGPLLIIAGPGSGKTHTLVERVAHLIINQGVPPEALLVSTFTEKAAAELLTRITNRLDAAGRDVNLTEMYLGTIHSICLRLLDDHREHTRLKRSYTVWDQFDQQYALFRKLKELYEGTEAEALLGPLAGGNRWMKAEVLAKRLNQVSEELIDPDRLIAATAPAARALGQLYRRYEGLLAEHNALDFSRIQVEALHLLEQHPEVLDSLRARLRYLMVDEYQDTNTVQEALLMRLAGSTGNLCVVGDDDQALYRFRGATVRNILEFPDRMEGCAKEHLVANFRSLPGIVDFYDTWMGGHAWRVGARSMRFDKQIEATRPAAPPAPHVVKVTAAPGAWEDEVLAFLRALQTSGRLTDWNQVAFLFRSVRNDQVLALARRLEKEKFPVYAPRSNLFFERPEVQLMVGALKVLFPQFDTEVTRKWTGDLPEAFQWYETCGLAFMEAVKGPEHADLRKWMGFRRKDHETLSQETDYAFTGLFYELLSFPLFANFVNDSAALGGVRDSRPARNLATLSRMLNRFEAWHGITVLSGRFIGLNLYSLFGQYLRFLFDGGIDEFEDEADYAPSGCIAFMTIHQAKGLQFPVTFVGLPPTGPRKQHDDLDEILQHDFYRKPPLEPLDRTKNYDFWRLFYTAFSRAQDLLVLTTPEKLTGAGRKAPCAEFHGLIQEVPSWRQADGLMARLSLSQVQKAEIKAQYSFTSHVTVYENCPRQYQFFKALDFTPVRSNAILFGTLVHQTIEDIHKAAIRDQADRIDAAHIEGWLAENYRNLSRRERRYLSPPAIASALSHVLRYVEHKGGRWDDVVAAEVDVSLVRDRYILGGSIDLLQGKDGTVEVVDFKAESKPDLDRDAERVARYRRQLDIYGFLVEKRFGKKVTRLHLHYTGALSGNPRISHDMNPERVGKTIATFDAVVDRIEGQAFGITERPEQLCKNCDLKTYCDRRGC